MELEKKLSWMNGTGTLLAAITLGLLLVGRFWWPSAEASDWAKTIRLGTCLALLCLSVQLYRERARLVSLPYLLFQLFWTVLLVNALLTDSSSSVRQLLLILFFTWMVMLLGGRDGRVWRGVLGVGVLAGMCFAGFSLLHKALNGQFQLGYRVMNLKDSGVPGVAEFGITIEAGLHYAFSFILAIWLLLCSRGAQRVLWAFAALLLFTYLYFTFARSAWVASLVGMGILLLSMTRGRQRLVAVGLALLAGLAVLVFGFEQLAYEFGHRGLTRRDEVWREVFERIDEAWWFGHGSHAELGEVLLSSGQVVHNPHSLYLEVLYQFGLVGLLSMLLAMAACLWGAWKAGSPLARLWFAVLAAAAVVMTVELHFLVAAPNLPWIWFWLPMAGCLAVATQQRLGKAA